MIKTFDEGELEFLMSGIGVSDVKDWKGNTEYKNLYFIKPKPSIIMFKLVVYTRFIEMRVLYSQELTSGSVQGIAPSRGNVQKHI